MIRLITRNFMFTYHDTGNFAFADGQADAVPELDVARSVELAKHLAHRDADSGRICDGHRHADADGQSHLRRQPDADADLLAVHRPGAQLGAIAMMQTSPP